jgi:hypothetical protein
MKKEIPKCKPKHIPIDLEIVPKINLCIDKPKIHFQNNGKCKSTCKDHHQHKHRKHRKHHKHRKHRKQCQNIKGCQCKKVSDYSSDSSDSDSDSSDSLLVF